MKETKTLDREAAWALQRFTDMLKGPSVALPGPVAVEDAADASRRAVRAFLAMEPDKVSLATWLLGSYREATSFGVRRVGQARHPSSPVVHHTTAMSVEVLVNAAKTVVRAALAAARRGVDDLVELLPPVVQVRPAHDVYGNHGFIPVDGARMRLADRVLALLVADYLTRSTDFQPSRPPTSGTHATKPWLALDLRAGTGEFTGRTARAAPRPLSRCER